jgi:flagellar hook-associated protein 3 FlgL
MVSLANTSFAGQYVFGGDDSTTQPYTFNWSAPGGVVQNNTSTNTATLTNSDGDSLVVPSQTAQQVFDTRTAAGAPAAGNIFQNIYALGQALQNNNQAAIQAAAAGSINSSAIQLGQATTISGNTLDWLQNSATAATSNLTSLQTQLSGLRDADATQAASNLTTGETAMQAAIAAQGTMNIKNLFSYLG